MLCNVLTIPEFDANVKKLSKRYPKLKEDLLAFINELQVNPTMGIGLIHNCYKIRLANSSVPTGKSKGFRVITYHVDAKNNIYLLTIYSKSDSDSISDAKIIQLLEQINQ